MNKTLTRLNLTVVMFLVFCARASWACSCSQTAPGECGDFKEVGTLFVGTVIGIENPADERRGADQSGVSRYRFRVDESIHGMDLKEVDVYSGRGGGDCSYHFRFGRTYFLNPAGDAGHLIATICSDTQPIEDAEPMLSELRARRDGGRHASLYGVLKRTQQPYEATSYDNYDRPIPNVSVEIRGANHAFSALTDKNGVFRFYEVPGDTYHFAAGLPPNLELAQTILSDPEPPVVLPDHACYQQDLEALPTGRIRGRIIGPEGAPLKYADVELFREDRYSEKDPAQWEFQGDERNYFEFAHLAPGKYLIVFHNSNRSDPNIPYSRTFYPGSPDLKSALAITIGEGQQVLNADIHVSGGAPTRSLIVRVQWTETPVPDDVYVNALASEGDQPLAKKVSPGVYQLKVFSGVRYTLFASQDCGLRWEGNTGTPIGARETERAFVDGSDDRVLEIILSLKDGTCKPYRQRKE